MKKPSLRILVVDDSANLRVVIKRYLSMNFDVEFNEAGNGEDALQMLQEMYLLDCPPDIIFLDWMMPQMTGLEFLQQMRGTEIFKVHPAVIMLTAETYSAQMNAALKFNVSSYVLKPFTPQDLTQAVQKVLDSKEELKDAV